MDGRPVTSSEQVVEQYAFHANQLDVRSIACGGGSIAFVDEHSGALRVGPRSAGSDPGPACYGRGIEPTVTDADVVLGHGAPADLPNARQSELYVVVIKGSRADPTRAARTLVVDLLAAGFEIEGAIPAGGAGAPGYDWLKSKTGGLAAYLLIIALVVGGLGWATVTALRLEREQLAQQQAADLLWLRKHAGQGVEAGVDGLRIRLCPAEPFEHFRSDKFKHERRSPRRKANEVHRDNPIIS